MVTLLRSKEPTRRRAGLRRRTLTRARGSKNFETNPVGVVEKHTAGIGAIGMRGHTPVVDGHAKLPKPLLRLLDLFDGIDLECQVVQPGFVGGKRPVTLLPQRQDNCVVLCQKYESTFLVIRLTGEIETENILIKTLRA